MRNPSGRRCGEEPVIYETGIGIEIAGIRRSRRLAFDYHVEMVDGERLPIHDGVCVLDRGAILPGKWIYRAIGPRQLKELDGRLMKHWDSKSSAQSRGGNPVAPPRTQKNRNHIS